MSLSKPEAGKFCISTALNKYLPDFKDKILLLESYGGTFTQMEAEKCTPIMENLVQRIVGKDLPIAVTKDIGHGTNAKGILIGQELHFR